MRLLLLTQYYYPETFKSTDIGEELVKRGHHVDVLCGIPNYPEGKYYKGYGLFKKRREIVNGVNIYRCLQTPRGKSASPVGLALNYISFVVSAIIWVLLFFAWKKKYDAILTHEPSPITQIIPAILLGKIRKTPVFSWILDIWPDSMVSSISKKQAKVLTPILSSVTEYVYRNSSFIMVSSKGMMDLVNRKHDYSKKLLYFPNWCDDILSLPHVEEEKLPDGFKIMMAGNLNEGIGVDTVIELIDSLKVFPSIKIILVGGGTKEHVIREELEKRGLNNYVMTGRLPFAKMPGLYTQADAMLLTLRKTDQMHLRATVPARLQSYMAAGKPILAMIDGCGNDIINQSDSGCAVGAGDVNTLVDYIRNEVLKNPDDFRKKGCNARAFFERFYQKELCISNLEYYLKNKTFDNPPYPVPNI